MANAVQIVKIVKSDVLQKVVEGIRAKVYTQAETDAQIKEKVETIPAYELPVASATELGGIKLGQGLAADTDGKVKVVLEGIEVDPGNIAKATATGFGVVKVGTGLDVAEGVISVNGDYAKTADVDSKISAAKSEIIGGAPETYDTLKEVADYIAAHKDVETALNAAIGKKADKATTLAGYGIADAKIAAGVITLGEESITPLTEHQSLADYAKTADVEQSITDTATSLSLKIDNCVKKSELNYMTEAEATDLVDTYFTEVAIKR